MSALQNLKDQVQNLTHTAEEIVSRLNTPPTGDDTDVQAIADELASLDSRLRAALAQTGEQPTPPEDTPVPGATRAGQPGTRSIAVPRAAQPATAHAAHQPQPERRSSEFVRPGNPGFQPAGQPQVQPGQLGQPPRR